MNDLTKEAIRRELEQAAFRQQLCSPEDDYLGLGLGFNLIGTSSAIEPISEQQYGNDYLEPDRPLTGEPVHYLTDLEGSKCVRLDAPLTGAYNEGYLDGFETGAEEESRTGINPDKINRVSDDYRKISDEVDNEIGE